MEIYVYDFEVYPDIWFVGIEDVRTRKKTHIINDKNRLMKWLEYSKTNGFLLAGFNTAHYDSLITTAILNDKDPFIASQKIIENENPYRYVGRRKVKYHPMEVDVSQEFMGSLKEFEGWSDLPLDESELPWDARDITAEQLKRSIEYNNHDLDATRELVIKRMAWIINKANTIATFGLDRGAMIHTSAMITAKLLETQKGTFNPRDFPEEYKEPYQFTRVNKESHDFFTQSIRSYWDWYDRKMAGESVQSPSKIINIGNLPIRLGTGGLHDTNTTKHWKSNDGYVLEQWDISSEYPSLMVYMDLISRGVNKKNTRKFVDMYHTRLDMKAKGDKAGASVRKVPLNAAYGTMGQETSGMYDPLRRLQVCFGGQTALIDLMLGVEPYADLLSANTDGIVIGYKPENKTALLDIKQEFEERTNFDIEIDPIKELVYANVNNYILRYPDDSVKVKGALVAQAQSDTHKIKSANAFRKSKQIVATAVVAYYMDGVPVEKTISECSDISKFAIVSKAQRSSYDAVYHGDKQVQLINRWVASIDKSLPNLTKHAIGKAPSSRDKIAGTADHVAIINNTLDYPREMIDEQYYINQANTIIKESFKL